VPEIAVSIMAQYIQERAALVGEAAEGKAPGRGQVVPARAPELSAPAATPAISR
jgi:hypothetical protein